MEIKIYSIPSCNACKVLKKRLTEKNIAFIAEDDEEKTLAHGAEIGVMAVPIIEIDGVVHTAQQLAKKIGL